ncbi:MAG TPA: portal protein, partial [Burkholderiaceae bacterium]|nr:portal protein [Burkholderiaceae bacterium]
ANGQMAISGPVAYTRPPAIPPAMAALLQITEQDMQDILGNQGDAEKIVSNISGKAVELIQNKLDMQTFIYMSNMAKAVKRSGEIWLSMAQDIFVESGRKMKTIGAQGEVDSVELLRPSVDEESGETIYENDLSEAKFDVAVDVGPSSSSRRSATVRALTGMMAITQDPETMQVLGAMAMMNMEGEGISDVRDFFRKKLLRMGVVKPTEQEAEQMMIELQGQPQDPNAVFLQAAAEEAIAKAAQARASTIKTVADAGLSRAKTAETLAKTSLEQQNLVLTEIEAAQQAVMGQEIQPVVR